MSNIRRYFNQNRDKIKRIAVIIIFGFIVLRFFNWLAANDNDYTNNTIPNTSNQETQTNSISKVNTQSALGGGGGNNTVYLEEANIITKFIEYCNSAKTNEAYNMLSNECKETMYPALESFIENYYKNNFSTSRIANIQRWTGSIYKVDLKENILHTGNINSEAKQDYITIVNQDGEDKLNINNYIGRTKSNKQCNIENLDIKVTRKDSFMNYETYTFEIKNNSEKDIYLDNLEKASTIYLLDKNKIKYTAYLHEMSKEMLHIYPYSTKNIQITFSNRYVSDRKISEIVFENIILDITNNESKHISIGW